MIEPLLGKLLTKGQAWFYLAQLAALARLGKLRFSVENSTIGEPHRRHESVVLCIKGRYGAPVGQSPHPALLRDPERGAELRSRPEWDSDEDARACLIPIDVGEAELAEMAERMSVEWAERSIAHTRPPEVYLFIPECLQCGAAPGAWCEPVHAGEREAGGWTHPWRLPPQREIEDDPEQLAYLAGMVNDPQWEGDTATKTLAAAVLKILGTPVFTMQSMSDVDQSKAMGRLQALTNSRSTSRAVMSDSNDAPVFPAARLERMRRAADQFFDRRTPSAASVPFADRQLQRGSMYAGHVTMSPMELANSVVALAAAVPAETPLMVTARRLAWFVQQHPHDVEWWGTRTGLNADLERHLDEASTHKLDEIGNRHGVHRGLDPVNIIGDHETDEDYRERIRPVIRPRVG